MRKSFARKLAMLLALVVLTTTFGSDYNSIGVRATEDEAVLASSNEDADAVASESSDADLWEEINSEQNVSEIEETEEVSEEETEEVEEAEPAEEVVEETPSEETPSEETPADEENADVPTDETPAEEAPVEETPSEETPEETPEEVPGELPEETEEVTAEAHNVTVTYTATKGGKVSRDSETIDINAEGAAFEGATASPRNDKYVFVEWEDAEGNEVSKEATFAPSNIEEDTSFTAVFKLAEEISMPELSAKDVHVGGMIVSVDAEEGLFPDGTEIVIKPVSDELALETAQNELGETAKEAKGVDISFKYEGKDIQPADERFVHVNLALEETIEGENFTVLHDHNGEVKQIEADVKTEDANDDAEDNTQVATNVEFKANQFSIFIVVGENEGDPGNNEYEVGTIRFFSEIADKATEEDVIFEKLVKNGDEIANPGVPHIGKNQEFLGWFVDGDSKGTEIVFTNDVYEVSGITHDCVIDVYPVMSSTYYVTFIGSDGEIARVEKVPVVKPEDAILDVTDSKFDIPAGAGKAFKGWSREKKTQYTDEDLITKEDPLNVVEAAKDGDIFLYAVIVPAFWVRFINNVGGEKGATFTDSQFLEEGDKLGKVLTKVPETQIPTRTGYEFLGWSLSDGDDREPLSDEEKNTLIQKVSTLDTEKNELKLYACWSPNATTKYTVVEWHQNRTLDGWDYYSSTELEGTTDAEIVFHEGQYYGYEYIEVYTDNDNDELYWRQYENPQRAVSGKAVEEYISDSEDTDDLYIQAGFEYNTQLESEVKIDNATERDGKYYVNASGNTIVNIYEVRREITVDFQYYGQGEYTYTPTTSNDGTQYGYVNGEYVPLTRHNSGSWLHPRYYWTYGYNNTRYNDTRYTRSGGGSSWQTYTRNGQFPGQFTGRYGQKFTEADSSYVWPSERTWHEQKSFNYASGTVTTFLDTFLVNRTCYSSDNASGSYTIRHYKMDINGKYHPSNNTADNTITTTSGGTFYFENKYNGFSVDAYAFNLNKDVKEWEKCRDPQDTSSSARTSVGLSGNNLYVAHRRNQYSVTFKIIDGNGDVIETKVIDDIYYEKPLNTVKEVTDYRDKSREITGYSFNWYKLPQGDPEGEVGKKNPEKLFDFSTTMPDGGIVIYGVYEPVKYRVTLDADGGTFVNELAWMQDKPAADRYFNVKSTEEVGRNTLISGVKKNGFELIGWYYVNADGSTGAKFEYGKVTEPVTLRAVWRNQGTVRVWYDTDASKGQYQDGSTSYIPDYNYATNSSVVLAAPPTGKRTENGGYSFIGWKVVGDKSETIYLPNGVFTIDNDIYAAGVDKEIEVVIDGETKTETYHCVHVVAQYVETGASGGPDELVDIKYDPNGGHLRSGVSETLTNGQVVVSGLKVNQKIVAKGAIFEKDGYVQVGWNTDPNNSSQGQYVKLGQEWIAGDKASNTLNTDINTLYAVYEPLKLYVVIEGTERTETYSGQAYADNGFSIKEKYYYEGNDKVHGAKVTVSDDVFNKDDIVYSGPSISETDVNRDADENVIAYTETLAVGDFAKASDVAFTVEFSIDDNNELKLTINPATVTVTTGSAEKEYDGTALTNATASATGFVNGESATVTATGTQTEVGHSTNGYQWNEQNVGAILSNYTVTENLGTLEVKKNTATITLTAPSDSKVYDGTALTCDGRGKKKVTASGLPNGFTVEATATGSQTNAGSSANVVDDGYVIRNSAGEDKTKNFAAATKVDGTLTVNKAKYTVTTPTATKTYDGTALTTGNGTINGLVNNETATVVATGSQTEVGTSANTYTITWGTASADNYELAENGESLGTLTVSQAEITLRADSTTKQYDGEALTLNRIVLGGSEKLPEGYKIVGTCEGTITDVGSVANVIKTWKIEDAEGNNKTANFNSVATYDGTLTVTAVPISVATGSASKAYDGTALTKDEASVTADGQVSTKVAAEIAALNRNITATGSQTDVGSSDNTYTINWTAASVTEGNYTITPNLGTLTVTANNAEITITANSNDKVYDGTALTDSGYTKSDNFPSALTLEAVVEGTITNVGTADNVITSYKILDSKGNDVNAYFSKIKLEKGTLEVTKAPLTVTTGSKEFEYDGTEHSYNGEKSISGLKNNETATINATGKITDVGHTQNTYKITWDGTALETNYKVTNEDLGTLTVTANDDLIQLIAASDSKTYDGTALTNSDVTVEGLPAAFTAEATASGSIKNVADNPKADEDGKVVGNNIVNDGYKIYKGEQDVTAFFTNVQKVDGVLTINPKAATAKTGSDSKPYDGTALTCETKDAEITGLVEGETATVTGTGTITEVGSTTNTVSIEWGTAKETNYTVTEEPGTLTITESDADVILTAPSDSKEYDGTPLTADGTGKKKVTATGLPEGFTVEATATGSITNVEDNPKADEEGKITGNNVVNDGWKIKDASGKDKTANFPKVAKVAGVLTITPKELTVTTGSDSKQYDGKALTNSEASITGFANNETATITATGSQTEVGSSSNKYEITWGNVKSTNYTITEKLGVLTVTENGTEITLIAPSDKKQYDGTPLTADGKGEKKVTATGLPEGFTVEATATGTITNVGTADNVVDDGYVIKNAKNEDKTASFTNFKKANGTLEVTAVEITISTGSDTKEYDGTPLTKDESDIVPTGTVSDAVKAEIAALKKNLEVTGEQTEVGGKEGNNTYDLDWNAAGVSKGNYTVKEELGTLTVTKNTTGITITAASAYKTYDGTRLEKNELVTDKPEGLPEGFTIVATVSSDKPVVEVADTADGNNIITDYAIMLGDEDKTENFKVNAVNGTLTIYPRNIEVSTKAGTKKYDGSALTKGATVSVDGNETFTVPDDHNGEAFTFDLVNDETASITITGTQTEVGSSDNTHADIDFGNYNAGNYNIVDVSTGKLTVSINDDTLVTLTAPSAGKVYDGTALTADGSDKENPVIPDGLPEGFTVEATATGTITNAGTEANKVDTYVIKDASGKDQTASFTNIKKVDGELTVTAREIIIDTKEGSKPYDGTPLTKGASVKVTGIDGVQVIDDDHENKPVVVKLVGDEEIEITVTGTITEVGTKLNDYSINWTKATDSNYSISGSKQNLTIEKNNTAIEFEAASAEKVYDGTALTKAELVNATPAGLPEGFTVEAVVKSTKDIINVADTAAGNNVVDSYVIKNAEGQDRTSSFTGVTKKAGKLTITPAEIEITTDTAKQLYNGKPLYAGATVKTSKNTTTIDAKHNNQPVEVKLIKDDKATVTITGKAVLETEPNEYTIVYGEGTDSRNYKIKDTIGALVITKRVDGNKFMITATTKDRTEVFTGKTWTAADFDYVLEGSVQGEAGVLGKAIDAVKDIVDTVLGALNVHAEDGTKEVEIDEAKFQVYGISVSDSVNYRDVGEHKLAMTVSEEFKIVDEYGNIVTGQFAEPVLNEGTLTITPMKVDVISGSATKVYDGTALTNNTVTVNPQLAEGDEFTYTFTKSQTEVGSTTNDFDIAEGNAQTKLTNYDITKAFGTLTVEPTKENDTPDKKKEKKKKVTTPSSNNNDNTSNDQVEASSNVQADEAAVLGAKRTEETEETEEAGVLGARRGGTDDTTDASRVLVVLIAAGAMATILATGKKRREMDK